MCAMQMSWQIANPTELNSVATVLPVSDTPFEAVRRRAALLRWPLAFRLCRRESDSCLCLEGSTKCRSLIAG